MKRLSHSSAEVRFVVAMQGRMGVGCWEWPGRPRRGGYGSIRDGRRGKVMTHRFAWERERGAIRDGMRVLHRCDNPKCVRVEHLFLGTNADNMRDKVLKNRQARGAEHGRSRLSAGDVRSIRALVAAGAESPGKIGLRLGVSRNAVRRAALRETWAHIP